MLPGPPHRGSLPYGLYLISHLTGDKKGAKSFCNSKLSVQKLGFWRTHPCSIYQVFDGIQWDFLTIKAVVRSPDASLSDDKNESTEQLLLEVRKHIHAFKGQMIDL